MPPAIGKYQPEAWSIRLHGSDFSSERLNDHEACQFDINRVVANLNIEVY